MPKVDPELLAPLAKISDILLKRPGKVCIDSIKRLSNIYGFETFTDTLKVDTKPGSIEKNLVYTIESHASTPIGPDSEDHLVHRLSLSGKILLIDIDFYKDKVRAVSISSAINIQPIEGKLYDFLKGSDRFDSVQRILLRNLQNATLDQFNKNLRILSQFDRLSMNSPNDLFNFFNQLAYNLVCAHNYDLEVLNAKSKEEFKGFKSHPLTLEEAKTDTEAGYSGFGQLLMNQQNNIVLFLQFCEDNRFVNRQLDQDKDIQTQESLNPYQIHFKITENVHSERSEHADSESPAVSASGKDPDAMDVAESTTENGNGSDLKFKWFQDGRWTISQADTILNSNLELLVLEMCPSVWIPEDMLMELGIDRYEVRSNDNDFFNDNQHQDLKDPVLDGLYMCVNRQHSMDLDLAAGSKQFRLEFLVGCPMVKIFKITIEHMNKISALLGNLRTWCLVNSIMRNLVAESSPETIMRIENGGQTARLHPDGLADASKAAIPLPDKPEKTDVVSIDEELRLDDVLRDYETEKEDQQAENLTDTDTAMYTIAVQNIRCNELVLRTGKGVFTIKNGLVYPQTEAEVYPARVLNKTEMISRIFS